MQNKGARQGNKLAFFCSGCLGPRLLPLSFLRDIHTHCPQKQPNTHKCRWGGYLDSRESSQGDWAAFVLLQRGPSLPFFTNSRMSTP